MSTLRKMADERLLAEAVRDWRSGRAYKDNRGTYKLRPIVQAAGVPMVGSGPGKAAPWNKIAKATWGSSTEGLHDASEATYGPREANTPFERMHGMDAVRARLVHEIAEGKPAAPVQLAFNLRPNLAPGSRGG